MTFFLMLKIEFSLIKIFKTMNVDVIVISFNLVWMFGQQF